MTHIEARVSCPCGAHTLPTFCRYSGSAAISCWIALDDDGRALPGCLPDARTDEIIPRRNARLLAVTLPPEVERPVYEGGKKVHCLCGRTAFVLTTNLNGLSNPPADPAPIDPAVSICSSSCWLAIADDGGPQEGCAPDSRTWEVLARARGIEPPQPEVVLEALPALRPSDESRLEFLELQAAAGTRRSKPKPIEPPPALEPDGPELSLFG
jgi:hypothetical protein